MIFLREKVIPVFSFNLISDLEALTSIISVCACFVQNAWGGVVTLTATKLFGFRSSDGVSSSLQALGMQKINKFRFRIFFILL